IKKLINSNINKYKIKLVAKDYTQLEGSNFYKIFSHVKLITNILVHAIIMTSYSPGNDSQKICQVKAFAYQQFKIKDLSSLKFFLGLEVARSYCGIILSQAKNAMEFTKYSQVYCIFLSHVHILSSSH
ncbi:hypothetical protein CR513_55204, partial [Mucuna pruriens]